MYIPDLTDITNNIPFRLGYWNLPDAALIYAVGWIDKPLFGKASFTQGQTPNNAIDALWRGHSCIFYDGTMGWHDCTMCMKVVNKHGKTVTYKGKSLELRGYGHYLVKKANAIYMCPELVLHYIIDHKYLPPPQFLEALHKGAILQSAPYAEFNDTADDEASKEESKVVNMVNKVGKTIIKGAQELNKIIEDMQKNKAKKK
jgi:hypothetical protein